MTAREPWCDALRAVLVELTSRDGWNEDEAVHDLVAAVEGAADEVERLNEAIRERDERLHRIHLFIDGLELRGVMNVALEDVQAGLQAAHSQSVPRP